MDLADPPSFPHHREDPMKRLLCLTFVLCAAAPAAAAEKPFFFQKGDRVLFLGDSITEQYQYSTDIELYLTTRFPEWKIFFLNAGIGGDTANGGAGRFQKQVLDEKPTAITINFGMNDGGYGKFDENRNKTYVTKTAEMLEKAKAAGVRVALLSPNAVDPPATGKRQENFAVYLETQKQFYAPLKKLAEENGATFVDQYATTRAVLEKIRKDDPEAKKVRPFNDGFHTASPGGLLMAHAILTGLNAPPIVSDVRIEGDKAETARCKVEGLSVGQDRVTFKRTDEAVPMPVQKDWVTLLPYLNELRDLNYYGLTAKGLKQGIWGVSINGKEVGQYSADDLSKGVNLGNATTGPVVEFGQSVLKAINAKNEVNKKRFRGTILSKKPDPEKIASLLEEMKQKQEDIYKMLTPQKYEYELKFVK
jgi:lysophospholipase L1-like esterase